ncbi:Uma2 family endonuclease [Belliella kenyensis]|uniref:Uma2 family endonuclease n=1 Tax=Belliella kenyensis TaxID=1472724 RepID=A0ABV8EKD2_9BACT|nr:Uma2 family endonuclease [Belliella kenyensis]MCH7402743.1 Uma2 family endonuclease [Belliella kenyensis]MDN3603709.1 Uma2 family endonuclease [Belliella kenyensis]
MEKEEINHKLEEPSADYGNYTYAEYLTWQLDGIVELIKGKVFRQAAAPRVSHQRVSMKISSALFSFLKEKKCEVFSAPFDVRLPVKSRKNEDITTVVQPDICVVCDPSKLDDLGCVGAPDLIIEILSPGNNKKEIQHKFEVYEESGVKEYWLIHPNECTLIIYSLVDGKYQGSRLFTFGDIVTSEAVEGFELVLDDVFEGI